MAQTQITSSKAETYTWGVEIECFLPQSKIQELGMSVGSYHHRSALPYPFPQGWTVERESCLRGARDQCGREVGGVRCPRPTVTGT
jgi:hypothetical protein